MANFFILEFYIKVYYLILLKRVTRQETELRVTHADELVDEGLAYSSITNLAAAKYGISTRKARHTIYIENLLFIDDIEKGDLNRPEMIFYLYKPK